MLVNLPLSNCRFGCQHERDARATYIAVQEQQHSNWATKEAGFCINPSYPFIGASPDGWVECLCCGKGLVEIKCPLCLEGKKIENMGSNFCLGKNAGDVVSTLKRDHAYYYQVQVQMHVSGRRYCDFVVWEESTSC